MHAIVQCAWSASVLIQEMSVFRSQKVTLIKYYLEAVAMHHLYCIIKMFACFKNGFVDANTTLF